MDFHDYWLALPNANADIGDVSFLFPFFHIRLKFSGSFIHRKMLITIDFFSDCNSLLFFDKRILGNSLRSIYQGFSRPSFQYTTDLSIKFFFPSTGAGKISKERRQCSAHKCSSAVSTKMPRRTSVSHLQSDKTSPFQFRGLANQSLFRGNLLQYTEEAH